MSEVPAEQVAFRTQLDQMTRQLVAVERRAKTLAELNRLLSQGGDPLVLAQRAVDLVMRATGASGTFVYLWDPETERLVLRVATTGRQAAHVGEIQLRLGEGVTGWSALMRQTVVLHDNIQLDPRFASFPVLEEDQFRSMVAVPIVVSGGDPLGVFSLYSHTPNTFDTHDVDLATEVGGLLGSGLIQAQTVKDLRRHSAAARFLRDVPSDATGSLQRCVDVLAESIRAQLDAALCTIELADRTTQEGHTRPGLAFADTIEKTTVAAAQSVRSRADLPALVDKLGPALEKSTTSFGNLFPLGAITCYRGQPFTEADTSILEALGAQAGALIASVSSPTMNTPLLGRLTAAPTPDHAERVLRDLGWRPGPTHPVLVRLRATEFGTPSAFDRVVAALHEMCAEFDDVVVAPSAPTVTLLIRHQPEQWKGFDQALRHTLRQAQTMSRGIQAGIGPPARDARDLASVLENTETALAWAELLGEPVVYFQDVEHLRLLPRVALNIGDDLREVLSWFAEVVRYDLRHGTSLAPTLETYLINRGSATDTASDLFIHRNTLRQRLTRIEDLTGRPVNTVSDWAVAALAARIVAADNAPQ